jgi:hypothetical protein
MVTKTKRMATVRNDDLRVELAHITLVHVFHAMSQQASVGGPYTISIYILEVW